MNSLLSVEMRAAQIPDTVSKLKFLRREMSRASVTKKPRYPLNAITYVTITSLVLVLNSSNSPVHSNIKTALLRKVARTLTPIPASTPEKIWLVEKTPDYWVYSNGLQVRMQYLTSSTVRHYATWSSASLAPNAGESTFPAGIVFHTTESLMLPLESGETHSLLRTREAVLDHIRKGRLYNYVIDRFGQVFRIIPDDEVAYHAGHSIWSDRENVYEGLNDSFLGVAFEARTDTTFVPDPAQIRSGRMLTDLLRNQFSIAASNCVTHAQVSVNPSNMQIGYHTDWAANFPFSDFGLPDGYATPLPAIRLFGFSYNHFFLEAIGGKPWPGLTAADQDLQRNAEARTLSPAAYRNYLQHKYQAIRSQKHEPTDRDWT